MDDLLVIINKIYINKEKINESIKKLNKPSEFRKNIDLLKKFMSCDKITRGSDKVTYYNELSKLAGELDARKYNWNDRDTLLNYPNTILHWALFNSCIYGANYLIINRYRLKLNINLQTIDVTIAHGDILNFTALHIAIIKGRIRCYNDDCNRYPSMSHIIKALINCDDLNIEIKDRYGHNAFDLALILYDYRTIDALRNKYPKLIVKQEIIDKFYTKPYFAIKEFTSYYNTTSSYYEKIDEKFDKDESVKKYIEDNFREIKKLFSKSS